MRCFDLNHASIDFFFISPSWGLKARRNYQTLIRFSLTISINISNLGDLYNLSSVKGLSKWTKSAFACWFRVSMFIWIHEVVNQLFQACIGGLLFRY